MTKRLAQTLSSDGIITPQQVEEALQRQVLYGGSIGVNLLETSAVSEEQLLAGLGKSYGLATAGKQEIDAISPHIPRLFPLVFAESYHLVPYRLDGDVLSVLLTGAPDKGLLDRIHERLRLTLSPLITSELRLHYAMNQLYGSELQPRFRALLSRLDGITVVQEPGAVGPTLSWGISSAHAGRAAGDPDRPKLNLRELLARLEFATDRDSIVDILLTASVAIFDYAALFLVQGQNVNGWRGVDSATSERVARITLPIELPSVFQTIYATGGHYLGPLPKNSVNGRLLDEMGRSWPRAAFVAPIIIGGRLAMIIYADNGPRVISPRRVAAVLMLAQRVSVAFERLIRKRKSSADQLLQPTSHEWDGPIEFDLAGPEGHLGGETPELADHEFEVVADGGTTDIADAEAVEELATAVEIVADEDGEGGDGSWEDVSFSGLDETPHASTKAFRKGLNAFGGTTADLESDHIPFADVDDTVEDNLEGWGDVLVDASDAAAKPPASAAPTRPKTEKQPPSVTWNEVVRRALSAAQLVPRPAPVSVEVAGTVVDETELLFDGLVASDPQTRRDAVERIIRLGAAADATITKRFPGELGFDPFDPQSRVPPFARCSGICELVLARGSSAAPIIVPFLDDPDRLKRFFAIYYLLVVRYPEALDPLARRLYDEEPRNRHLAADALRTYQHETAYQQIVQGVREQLALPPPSQITAVHLLGQLRDPSAVPELIPLVASPAPEAAKAAQAALAVICANDHGGDLALWSEWWRANYNHPRPVWLIQSLRHSSNALRRIANYELQLMTGMTTHYDPDAQDAEREEKIRMWENWWLHFSRAQQPRAEPSAASAAPGA